MAYAKRALALGFLLFVAIAPQAQGADPKVIVFDLDGVVLFHPEPNTPASKTVTAKVNTSENVDSAANVETYRVADGFAELVQSLEKGGWKINVFSFGGRTRNVSALQQIRLPDGRSAYDALIASGGKVFSGEDGINLDPNDKRKFDHRVPVKDRPRTVKSLATVLGEDAKHAIIVEDQAKNVAPGERATNFVSLPYRYVFTPDGVEVKFLESFEPTEAALRARGEEAKIPAQRNRFDRLHNRMEYLAGLLARAEDRAALSGRGINEELADLQFVKDAEGKVALQYSRDAEGKVIPNSGVPTLRDELLDDAQILARGRERLKRANSAVGVSGDGVKTNGAPAPKCMNFLDSIA